MAVLSITQSYSVEIDGQTYTGGSTTAQTVTVAGETIFDRTYSVTTATLTEIFQAGATANDDLADWIFMFIQSDVAAEIRLIMGKGSSSSTTRHGLVMALAAGVPLMLTGGDGSRGATSEIDDALAATWPDNAVGVIDAIEISQTSGGAGKVRVVAIR